MGPNNSGNLAPSSGRGNYEATPNVLPQHNVDPTTSIDTGRENMNVAPAPPVEQAPVAPPPLPVLPPIQATTTPDPATAADQDDSVPPPPTDKNQIKQLEREWVDKTQDVISRTKNDPYEQAHQISVLMKGYLRAKYGKIIGKKK